MRILTRAACAAALVVCLPLAASADLVILTAELDGLNEVPPVSTTATGVATLTLDLENGTLAAIPLHLEFSGLSGAQTGAHIHQAPAGANGPAIITLPLGSPVDTTIGLTLPQYAALASEGLYVNIQTVNFPAGEIRGQFIVTSTVADEGRAWGAVKALFR